MLATGCGGGAEVPSASGPQLQGKVVSVNGAPLALDGVAVECLNDGTSTTTAQDGTFRLDVPAGERLRVRFRQRLALGVPSILPGGCTEDGDTDTDRSDLDDDVVEVGPLEEGNVCGVEVELADGRVVECDVDHPGGDGPRFHGEGVLVPVRPMSVKPPLGEVEVQLEGDCAALEVEAVLLVPGAPYEVVLVSPGLAQAALGTLTADEDGTAHLRVEACDGDPLPFGVDAVSDLAGYGVFVNDADGQPVLVGQVPGRGHEWGEPGHTDGHPGGVDGHPPGDGTVPPLPPINGLPGVLPDPGTLPPPPDDLLDLLDDLLGGNPLAGGLPGNAP